jgi:predicted nucleic acid-binding protein
VIVADVNLIAYLLIEGEHSAAARSTMMRDPVWVAPPLWRIEFVNVLATNIREGKFTMESAMEKLRAADVIVETSTYPLDDQEIIGLSIASRMATYDCTFVWLGRRQGLRVVTQDGGMLSRFADTCVSIRDFAQGN